MSKTTGCTSRFLQSDATFYAGCEHMTDTTKNFPLTLFKPGLSP